MTQQYVSRAGNIVTRQRAEQLRHPERMHARNAVHYAIIHGDLARPQDQACTDCGKQANEYDHYLGYAPERRLDVQPVCNGCHYKREQVRRTECRNGHPYVDMSFDPRGQRRCLACGRETRDRARTRKSQPHTRPHRARTGNYRQTSLYLYEEHEDILNALIASGYGPTYSEVLRRLIEEANQRIERAA